MTKLEHLFDCFKPNRYELKIDISPDHKSFTGTVLITGDATSEIIKLHANYLNIESVTLDDAIVTHKYENNILEIPCEPGRVRVEINYSGKITDQMTGLYPSYYNIDDREYDILSTQFESHYAREVFPCVDEPLAKAEFVLKLITETDLVALSNTPVASKRTVNKRLITAFEPTPIMSPYLLGFVIGDLQYIEAKTKSGKLSRVYSTKAHAASSLKFALEIATEAIDWYEEYLGIAYPLPKCDHIAIPDFAAGAMENWGLVTYRESMLIATTNASINTKQSIASTIVHELAHMWFGNLVTMKWWDELWLNESLATLMQYMCLDGIKPSYEIWDDFIIGEYQYAKNRDSIKGVQPVWTKINHPDEISSVFDGAIVYAKGAALMLQLKNYIGEKDFKEALNEYLIKFAYSNPSSKQFLTIFDNITNKDISGFMKNWLTKPGYPILTATMRGTASVSISQSQFGYGSNTIWQIPITTDKPVILENKQIVVKKDSFNILNPGPKSYFVSNYDPKLKQSILDAIQNAELAKLDKLNFLQDELLLADNQIISSSGLVDNLISLKNERSELIWQAIARTISNLKFFVRDTKAEVNLKNLIKWLARPIFDELGWAKMPSDTQNQTKLRPLILSLLAYADDQEVIKQIISIFDKHGVENLSKIDPQIRAVVIATKVKHGYSPKLLTDLLISYRQTADPEIISDIQSGLTAIRNYEGITDIINKFNDSKLIKPQDLGFWYAYLLRNPDAKDQTWRWLKKNFDNLRIQFSENKQYDDFVRYTASAFYTDKDIREFSNFFDDYIDDLAIKRSIQVGIESIRKSNSLYNNNRTTVINRLERFIG